MPLIEVRADQPTTWGRDRDRGQWLLAGRWNPAGARENLLRRHGQTPGHWINDTTMVSHEMPDGSVERLRLTEHEGLAVVETAAHCDPAGYQFQEGAVNTTIGPPESDWLMWDAPRAQLDLGATGFDIRDPFRVVTVFVVPEWAPAHHNMTCVWELHEPRADKGGPLMASIRDGHLYVVGKYSPDPQTVGPDDDMPWYRFDAGLVTPGELMALVWDVHLGHHLTLINVTPTGQTTLVEEGADWGWSYDDPALNTQFRAQCFKTYPFLRWHPDHGDANVSGIPNWDTRYGPIRRFAHRGFAADTAAAWPLADAVDWARGQLAGPTPRPPDPIDDLDTLRADLEELRQLIAVLCSDVDQVTAAAQTHAGEIANLRDGWSALAGLARSVVSDG